MVRKNALDHFGLRVLENTLLSEHIFPEQLRTLRSEVFSERGEENNSLPLKLRASKSKNKMASTEEDGLPKTTGLISYFFQIYFTVKLFS